MKHRMHFIAKSSIFFIRNLGCTQSEGMKLAWKVWRHVGDSQDMGVWKKACVSFFHQENAQKKRKSGYYYNYRTAKAS